MIHVLACPEPICNTNHVANVVQNPNSRKSYDPSSIRQAVNELADDHYLQLNEWKGTTRELLLTMKGAATAAVHTRNYNGKPNGVYSILREYTRRHNPGSLQQFENLEWKVSGGIQKDIEVVIALELALESECFDENGNESISDEKKIELQLKIAKAARSEFGPAEIGSEDYYKKYGISQKFTVQALDDAQRVIDEARSRLANKRQL